MDGTAAASGFCGGRCQCISKCIYHGKDTPYGTTGKTKKIV